MEMDEARAARVRSRHQITNVRLNRPALAIACNGITTDDEARPIATNIARLCPSCWGRRIAIELSYGDNYIRDNTTPVSGTLTPVTTQ
jgi:hypothetical protein